MAEIKTPNGHIFNINSFDGETKIYNAFQDILDEYQRSVRDCDILLSKEKKYKAIKARHKINKKLDYYRKYKHLSVTKPRGINRGVGIGTRDDLSKDNYINFVLTELKILSKLSYEINDILKYLHRKNKRDYDFYSVILIFFLLY